MTPVVATAGEIPCKLGLSRVQLLVAEGFDRIDTGRFAGGEESSGKTDQRQIPVVSRLCRQKGQDGRGTALHRRRRV